MKGKNKNPEHRFEMASKRKSQPDENIRKRGSEDIYLLGYNTV
jgi:hypothetical protein